jgi:hypothetical protein
MARSTRWLLGGAFVLAPMLAGCPDDDAAVFVEPSIEAPNATVTTVVTGTSLAGSFQLTLHLGPRASGSSEVGVGSFTIQSSDQQTTIVSPLEVAADRQLPAQVPPDSDVTIGFSFDTGANPLPMETAGELCGAGGIVIHGVIEDSLQDGATPVVSEVFIPDGC